MGRWSSDKPVRVYFYDVLVQRAAVQDRSVLSNRLFFPNRHDYGLIALKVWLSSGRGKQR